MGLKSRTKGAAKEREFAKAIGGKRVPLSGAMGGEYSGDVVGMGLTWQVKARANGFKFLHESLKGHDALALKADRKGWLIVIPLETWLNLDKEES